MTKLNKRKRRVFNKLDLIETSIVGIPAYPDAHMSLIKELSKIKAMTTHGSTAQIDAREKEREVTIEPEIDTTSLESNKREDTKMPEEEQTQTTESSDAKAETESTEEVVEEKPVEAVTEEVPEEAVAESENKDDKIAEFKAAMVDAFMDAAKQLNANRGLEETTEKVDEDKSLDAGQLAVKYNIFAGKHN